MSAADRKAVLDASAIVDFLTKGRGWETIERILPISVVTITNLAEALAVIIAKRLQQRTPTQLTQGLLDLGLVIDGGTPDDAIRAAELVASSRANPKMGKTLSLGDAMCIAYGDRRDLLIVGADQLWEALDISAKIQPYR